MSLTNEDFEYVTLLMRDKTAISLGPDKRYLVRSRLEPLAATFGFGSLSAMIGTLRAERYCGELHKRAIEALTTNETLFFRDGHPFECLADTLLPDLICKRSEERRLAIWSAACSSGQEAYSLAMLIRERFPVLLGWNLTILGTDLSTGVLEKARQGFYSPIEINRGLPDALREKYFEKEGECWRISDSVRRMVEFRQMNLFDPWPALPRFDLVMMRNVLIYFDVETKTRILGKARRVTQSDGALFLGASETTLNLDPEWERKRCGRSIYFQLKGYSS